MNATINERPERCETCRFWESFAPDMTVQQMLERSADGHSSGTCRRYPPLHSLGSTFTQRPDLTLSSSADAFPETAHDDWCGEWQPKPETKTV